MAWIKKNLVFTICAAVALVLLGIAGWMMFSNIGRDNAIQEELNQELANWQSLNSDSFPSDENIQAAAREKEKLLAIRKQAMTVIPAAAPAPKLSDQEFVTLLGTKISQLRSRAEQSGVMIPEQYDFTFAAQRKSLNFPAGSIENWLPQLNDIESICNVLYGARVNAIENIQRVAVSPLDTDTAELFQGTIVSNEFGIYRPYQVTFRGFSAELAAVLEGMQRATNFIVVKSLTVGPSNYEPGAAQSFVPATAPVPVRRTAPVYNPPQSRASDLEILAGGGRTPQRRYAPTPTYRTTAGAGTAAGRATDTVLSEGPLQVTLLVDVVKLNPAQ